MKMDEKKLYIAGCGYIGEQLSLRALADGWDVTVQVRDENRAVTLRSRGCVAEVYGADELDDIPSLKRIHGAVLLYSIPPQGGGTIDMRLRAMLAACRRDGVVPTRLIYLSATSVYGDTGGEVVTEASPVQPTSAMGKRRLDAEELMQEYAGENDVPLVVLRVSAIYGKGRLPLMQIAQRQPLLDASLAKPSNRIHGEDLVQVCLATLTHGLGVYNVSDGSPSSMTDYFNACADALGKPRQPQVSLEEARQCMPPLLFNYFMESRVVDNSRMIRELGVGLRYPDSRAGIPASL